MDIRITFPGGKRVDADLGTHIVRTDQTVAHGGQGSAAEPFDLFLASLGTCAGIYVLGFCQARGISTEGIELLQHNDFENGQLKRVGLEIVLAEAFPQKYRQAIVRAAEGCKVKKVLASPPEITVTATIAGAPTAMEANLRNAS